MKRLDNLIAGDTYEAECMAVVHRYYRSQRIERKLERMACAVVGAAFVAALLLLI